MTIVPYIHIALEIWGCIFCLIAAMCVYISRGTDNKTSLRLMLLQICNALILIADAFAWSFRGSATEAGRYLVRGSNFLVFFLSYVILMLYVIYCWHSLSKESQNKVKIRVGIIFVLCSIAGIAVIISQFTDFYYFFDERNFYHRTKWFPLTQVSGLVGSAIAMSILIQFHKELGKRFVPLVLYNVLPICAMVIQIFLYGISFLNIAITISVLFMFVEFQIEQAQLFVQRERELEELQTDIALSQIGSHFIFNSLTAIKYLCRNEKEAMCAVDEFSKYLRCNLDGIATKECITLEKELSHVRNYMRLEERRFGERVKVVYEINEVNFRLPALSLQPLVENAVKHGITKKVEGGTITISTAQDGDFYRILIEDDGVGFDEQDGWREDGKSHIGISNVRSRITRMCQGSLEIQSVLGLGTKAIIRIPKK